MEGVRVRARLGGARPLISISWSSGARSIASTTPGSARNLDEFKRRRHNYAITQAGELAERFLEDLDNLRERVGALGGLAAAGDPGRARRDRRRARVGRARPAAAAYRRSTTSAPSSRRSTRAPPISWRSLRTCSPRPRPSTTRASSVYKDRVIRYLSGFASEFRRCAQRVEDQILRVEELGVEPMLALAASVDEPPVFGKTAEEVAELRRAEKRDAWRALSAWFVVGRPRGRAVAEADRDARRRDRLGRRERDAARRPPRAADRPLGRVPASGGARAARRRGRVPPRLRRRVRARRAPSLLRHRRGSAEGGAAADRLAGGPGGSDRGVALPPGRPALRAPATARG